MSEETLRRQLYDSFANRAHVYHLLFRELPAELGEQKAAELMGKAIYRRGAQNAGKYAPLAPRDFEGLKRAFLANLPDDGAMFAPEVVRCDAAGLDVQFHRCPLKQAWLDAGLSEEGGQVAEGRRMLHKMKKQCRAAARGGKASGADGAKS